MGHKIWNELFQRLLQELAQHNSQNAVSILSKLSPLITAKVRLWSLKEFCLSAL